MKSIRAREEHLDDLRRRRKELSSNTDNTERKLSKMGADNKNLLAQKNHLRQLREEIRILDTDIMEKNASLRDYKRSTAKAWLGIKFGALLECCEKGVVRIQVGPLGGKFTITADYRQARKVGNFCTYSVRPLCRRPVSLLRRKSRSAGQNPV